ncbi:hypothetical protein IIA28_11685 [candidate division KSB1 bacterium]|nr:hypothetical protein [candidate division KSB1 bacterium]
MDDFNDIFIKIADELSKKREQHKEKVFDSQQFQQELKHLSAYTFDFVQCIRSIAFYSTRAKDIYDNFLTIRASDDYLQLAIGVRSLVVNGIQNMAKRELRYMIEMTVKYLIVDQELMGKELPQKTEYLKTNIPNSSIDVIERMNTPFNETLDLEFKSEIKDFFYKSCAYVHPSKKQIEEQLNNYKKGYTIGFESASMLCDISKLIFRAYDMILVMLFHGFGESMSGDLFIQNFDEDDKWKFHKGKYVKQYSKLFDYKLERKSRKNR